MVQRPQLKNHKQMTVFHVCHWIAFHGKIVQILKRPQFGNLNMLYSRIKQGKKLVEIIRQLLGVGTTYCISGSSTLEVNPRGWIHTLSRNLCGKGGRGRYWCWSNPRLVLSSYFMEVHRKFSLILSLSYVRTIGDIWTLSRMEMENWRDNLRGS